MNMNMHLPYLRPARQYICVYTYGFRGEYEPHPDQETSRVVCVYICGYCVFLL